MPTVQDLTSGRILGSVFIIAGLLIGLGLSGPGVTQARPVGGAPNAAVQTYSFSFQDADISAVASEILGTTLGLNYTIDPAITGKMSLRIDQRLTRLQLLEAFEAALAAQDVAIVHQGDSLALEPPAKARLSVGVRSADAGVRQAGYQVLAVPLAYATPSEVAKVLEAVAPAGMVLYSNDKSGLLILGGGASELQSALDTVKAFDRDDLQDSHIRWFTLSKASAQSVSADLDKLAQASGIGNVAIAPMKRLNGLFVVSRSPAALDFIAKWVDRLDQASQDTSSNLYAYHPRNVSADALAHTLAALFGGAAGTAGGPGGGGPGGSGQGALTGATPLGLPGAPLGAAPAAAAVTPSLAAPPEAAGALPNVQGTASEDSTRFSVDKDSNTLLVAAPLARWIALQSVLAEIDRPPRQILIEASILEVTLTKDFHFGVDWSVLGSNKRLSVTEVGSNAAGTIAASYPGFSTTFLSGTVQAAITTLGEHSDVEVVSAPKIIALDNHTARLEVGDQVPIITQSSQSTISANAPVIDSVDYKNTGVILTVTPRISGENKIVLDVAQEVSSVAATSTSSINSPTIQERKLESTLVLPDGGVVALGGLISTNKTKTITGIPLIESAPVIGALFRDDTRSSARTELVVLLTSKILPDPALVSPTMTALEADMKEIKARGLLTLSP